jgi:hypothetical protein
MQLVAASGEQRVARCPLKADAACRNGARVRKSFGTQPFARKAMAMPNHQNDDCFTHCLILKNGKCWILGQGLEQVYLRVFKAPEAEFKKLKTALNAVPAAWPLCRYGGFNFMTDAEGTNASQIAAYGKRPGGRLAGYFVPPSSSQIEALVRPSPKVIDWSGLRKMKFAPFRSPVEQPPPPRILLL